MGLSVYFEEKDGSSVEIESNLKITHNLNKILLELDKINGGETCYYEVIWRPDELFACENGEVLVKDVLKHIPNIISDLVFYQTRLEQHLPENGYGDLRWLYSFLCDYLKECLLHQDKYIYCYR